MRGLAAHVIVRCVDAAGVVAQLSRVFTARDWRAMRALYHPDALILTVTGGPDPLTADEIIAELERVSHDLVYSVSASEPMALDEHAVIISGRMRRRLPKEGFEEAGHVWLLTVRDGLIYRQSVHHETEAAVAAYASGGVSLGVGDP